jgi:hypothetical protein
MIHFSFQKDVLFVFVVRGKRLVSRRNLALPASLPLPSSEPTLTLDVAVNNKTLLCSRFLFCKMLIKFHNVTHWGLYAILNAASY